MCKYKSTLDRKYFTSKYRKYFIWVRADTQNTPWKEIGDIKMSSLVYLLQNQTKQQWINTSKINNNKEENGKKKDFLIFT